jgi:hypothetical protein
LAFCRATPKIEQRDTKRIGSPRHHAGADIIVILGLEFLPLQLRGQTFRASPWRQPQQELHLDAQGIAQGIAMTKSQASSSLSSASDLSRRERLSRLWRSR